MLQSEKIKITSLEVVFYFSSELTLCLRNYTHLKKLVWRSSLFLSRLLNQLGLNFTIYIYQTPQLNIFHPISLTSCVVKLLEHILADHLYYIAETNNMFSGFQAGFPKGWSCEDQITQIVQAIQGCFQQCTMKCSLLTLLDFSKAYDMVWREKLLLHMLNTAIPSTFICWIWSFLNDHRERVQLFNIFSSSQCFSQGLPQGSVLTLLVLH